MDPDTLRMLPALNASLNATSALCLITGWVMIRIRSPNLRDDDPGQSPWSGLRGLGRTAPEAASYRRSRLEVAQSLETSARLGVEEILV